MTERPIVLDYASFKKSVENISLLEKTGTLDIRDKKTGQSYYFYIKNGEIIYIEEHPVCLENRIGDTLLRQGLITDAQLQQALEKQKKNTYEFLGDLLLKEGFISPRELLSSLTQQIENVLFSISLIRDGEFVFREDETPDRMPQIPYTITLSSLLLIFLNSSEILVKMPFLKDGLDMVLPVDSVAVNINSLNPTEQAVVDGFRKGHSLKDLLESAKETNHITLMTIIASLYDRNILRAPGEPPPPVREPLKPSEPVKQTEEQPPAKPPETKKEDDKSPPMQPEPVSEPRYNQEPIEFVYKPEPAPPVPRPSAPPRDSHTPRPAPQRPTYQKPAPEKSKPRPRPVRPPVKPVSQKTASHPGTYALVEILSFISVLCLLILYLALLKPLFQTPVTEHLSILTSQAMEEIKKERTLQMGEIYSREELLDRLDGWQNPFYVRGEDIYSSGADEIPDTPDDFRVR
ncbi:MAG TPA: DUF4388 domain-containing protein [Candidatus Mcinerneyibacteriales bacterium]|nr:DUF4388 domain-containing protein [Candidatus Mcinerneyibacteriales bacterium]